MLRLRWALVHLTAPATFKPQKCCWSGCPSTDAFPHLAGFLAHFDKCKYSSTIEYPCLLSLERAWYDNRCAWLMLVPNSTVRNQPGLTWPIEFRKFEKGQRVPLDSYHGWHKMKRDNTTIEAVRYGVSVTYSDRASKSVMLTRFRECSWYRKRSAGKPSQNLTNIARRVRICNG